MVGDAEMTVIAEVEANPPAGSNSAPSITVVIPAFNEQKTISQIVQTAKLYADDVLVVDDGSDDLTGELALRVGATVIRIPKNAGKGNALGTGMSTAAMNGCGIVVCLDADGQHDPSDIPKIVQPIIDGNADMVIGSRFLSRETKDLIPAYRKIGQSILTSATNIGNPVKISDSQSGYRVFRKDIIGRFSFSERGMGIESEMIRDAVRSGARIQEVPITAKYRGIAPSTFNPGSHGFAVFRSIIRSIRSEHPLLYFGVAGTLIVIFGLALGSYSLYEYFISNSMPLGMVILAVVIVFMGILCAAVGLILNAISEMIDTARDNRRSH